MSTAVYKGDIGVKIVLDCGLDISTATTKQIKYRKPRGDAGAWTATLESDNASLSYTTTAATDLSEVGTWRLQAYVVTPTFTESGEICHLSVLDPL